MKTLPSKNNSEAENSRIKLVQKEFGGPAKKPFSELAPRNTCNKMLTLSNHKLTFIDSVNPNWVIMTVDLSKNELKEFPTVLSELASLNNLNLNENLISAVSFQDLLQFKNLQQLEMANNNMKMFMNDFDELTPLQMNQIYHQDIEVPTLVIMIVKSILHSLADTVLCL